MQATARHDAAGQGVAGRVRLEAQAQRVAGLPGAVQRSPAQHHRDPAVRDLERRQWGGQGRDPLFGATVERVADAAQLQVAGVPVRGRVAQSALLVHARQHVVQRRLVRPRFERVAHVDDRLLVHLRIETEPRLVGVHGVVETPETGADQAQVVRRDRLVRFEREGAFAGLLAPLPEPQQVPGPPEVGPVQVALRLQLDRDDQRARCGQAVVRAERQEREPLERIREGRRYAAQLPEGVGLQRRVAGQFGQHPDHHQDRRVVAVGQARQPGVGVWTL
ncbi:MAG: hypothetical protein WD336_01245, partial [Trueperaceae bacterium]